MLNKWHAKGDHFSVELWGSRSHIQMEKSIAEAKQLHTLVDAAGLQKMMEHSGTWGVKESKRDGTFYVAATALRDKNGTRGRKTIMLHRLLTNCPSDLEPDHLNHDGLDNRPGNLKVGTHQENMRNTRPPRKPPCINCGHTPTKTTAKEKRGIRVKTGCAKCDQPRDVAGFIYCSHCMVQAYLSVQPTPERHPRTGLRIVLRAKKVKQRAVSTPAKESKPARKRSSRGIFRAHDFV